MNRKESIRRSVLGAALAAALALPAAASAMPVGDGPIPPPNRNAPSVVVRPTSAPAPSVVREIRTITENANQTLPIVLGSIALGIALTGAAYTALRLRPMLRRTS